METLPYGSQRDRFLLEHAPIVLAIARSISARLPKHVELDELVAAGNLGLIEACDKFDPGRNVEFRTYAKTRIRGAMLDNLRELDWGPRGLRRWSRVIQKTTFSLMAQYGRAPSEPEIARAMDMSLAAYQHLLGELKGLEIASLDEVCSEGDAEESSQSITNSRNEDPLLHCIAGEVTELVTQAIEELPEREKLVIALYYYEELKQDEIALILQLSEARISQIRRSALERLRARLGGFEFLGPASAKGAGDTIFVNH